MNICLNIYREKKKETESKNFNTLLETENRVNERIALVVEICPGYGFGPRVSRRQMDIPVHCYAWSCLSIVTSVQQLLRDSH